MPAHPHIGPLPFVDDPVDGLPPVVQASLVRHRENLASMVAALRAAGLDEVSIEGHLAVLIESYRTELSTALHHLRCDA